MSQVIEKPWGKIVLDDEGAQVGRIIENRRLFVVDEEFSKEPNSLLGSAFLVFHEGGPIWQGVVVAEPDSARYLVELDKLDEGVEKVQRLFSLDTLMGTGDRRFVEGAYGTGEGNSVPLIGPDVEWRFYNDAAAAQDAYLSWCARELSEEPVEAS